MQYLFRPLAVRTGRQLEDVAAAVRIAAIANAARPGRPVQVSGGVENETGKGVVPILEVEAVQDLFRPLAVRAARQLEDIAAAWVSAS